MTLGKGLIYKKSNASKVKPQD